MAKQNQHDRHGRNHQGQADDHPFHEPNGLLQLAEPDVQGAGEAEYHTRGGGGLRGEVLGGHDHHGAAGVEQDPAQGDRAEER